MKSSVNFKKYNWLWIAILLYACGAPNSPAIAAQSIDDMIIQTSAAAQTQTATNLPSVTPTQTSIYSPTPRYPSATPTATFLWGIAVETPVIAVIETPNASIAGLSSGSSSGSGVTVKMSDEMWSCMVVGKSPSKDATIKPGSNIYVSWTVVNNGTSAWSNNGVDFVYDGGYRHEGGPIQDLYRYVPVGGEITLKVLIVAPKKEGKYGVIWSLKVGQTMFCHMKVNFVVKR